MNVGETWFVRLPENIELTKCEIKYLTDKVVTISYSNAYSHVKTYKLASLEFIEEYKP